MATRLMKVTGLTVDPTAKNPIVILKDESEQVTVPIYIGLLEANAIAIQLEKVQLPRPLTHDLLATVIRQLGGSLQRIEVTELRDNTYFARLYIERQGTVLDIDARPSDSIALALRLGAPIWVHDEVIAKVGTAPEPPEPPEEKKEKDRWTEFLENLNPDDFSKYPV